MLASLMVPATAPNALALLEQLDVEPDAALSELIIAKDDKGKSRLLALMSGGSEACVALVDKLCADNATIKAAIVSADMFLAMAKPATAGVALQLIEEKGLIVGDEIISSLLTGPFSWAKEKQ